MLHPVTMYQGISSGIEVRLYDLWTAEVSMKEDQRMEASRNHPAIFKNAMNGIYLGKGSSNSS
jgi:hypothetical protein